MDDRTLDALSPEAELVVRCAALEWSDWNLDRVRWLAVRPLDWTSVLTLAQRHGVGGSLHERLMGLPSGTIPSPVSALLSRWTSAAARRSERRRTALGELLAAFAGARIGVMPLRCAGATAASALVTIDLLVRPADVAASIGLLARWGFVPETPLVSAQLPAVLHTLAAWRFAHEDGHVVSLQWAVEDRAIVHGPGTAGLWQRALPDTLVGHPCLTPTRTDLLHLLCVRGTVRRWHRLVWVCEAAELIDGADATDLERTLVDAARDGSQRALGLGVVLAVDLLGARAPARLVEVGRDATTGMLRRDVLADLVATPRPLPGPSRIARFHLGSRERLRDRVRYVIRRATAPTARDLAAFRLPRALWFLTCALCPLLRAGRAALQFARIRWGRGAKLARFSRTPPQVVDRMLGLARATTADTLLDIGCGDGAIVIRAARRVGCRCVGVDVDPALLQVARASARSARVEELVTFVQGDAREVDLGAPTIVLLYLNAGANRALRPLLEGLREGTRVVSFNFDMGDWWPDDVEVLDETPWGSNTIYLWHIVRRTPAVAPVERRSG